MTDGLGAETSITYKPMTDPSVYTKDSGANAASYPVVDVVSPMQVTSKIERSDGLGGTRVSTYRYAGAKMDLTGRGFLGFREMRATDQQTGIVQTSVYRQTYPFTTLKASETRSLGGTVLNRTVNSYDAVDLGATRRQVLLTQSVSTGADLSGEALPSSTTTYQHDAFGNATEITVTTSDGFSKTTTNTYSNDTDNWLLGRLLTAKVSSQAPEVAEQAPVEDTTPDGFDFTDVTDALLNTVYEDSVAVTGVNRPVTATVSGGDAQIRKNGSGDWVSSLQVMPGDTLNIRMTSGSAYDAVETATVTAGGVSSDWTITAVPRNRTLVIAENVYNLNLRSYHDSLYPPPVPGEATPITVTAVIQPGVIVGSTSTATPALDVGDWPAEVEVTLNVQGRIQGAGGDAPPATGGVDDGNPGGDALKVEHPIELVLNEGAGEIWSGGGSGGSPQDVQGGGVGGGGGGAGTRPGLGGSAYQAGSDERPGKPGGDGTSEAGGAGGGGRRGGSDGGDPGQDGDDTSVSYGNAQGGAAGVAIDGSGFVTQIGTGDIRGPSRSGNIPSAAASMVFNGSDEALVRIFASSSPETTKFTYSLWVKVGAYDSEGDAVLFQTLNPTQDGWIAGNIYGAEAVEIDQLTDDTDWIAGSQWLDPVIPVGEWAHIVYRYDSTQAAEADRIRVYLNGADVTDGIFEGAIAQSGPHALFVDGWEHQIGGWLDASAHFNGKLAFIDVLEGVSAGPEAFAFDNNGTWSRKPYEGAYGSYGFSLDGSTGVIGADVGPNGQHFTAQNMDASNLDASDLPPHVLEGGATQTSSVMAVNATVINRHAPTYTLQGLRGRDHSKSNISKSRRRRRRQ